MNKKIINFTIIGIIFTSIFGTLLHFAYNFFNENFIIGLFAPINESIWEHMKLVFFPMILYSIIEYFLTKKSSPSLLYYRFIGILISTWLVPIIFYTYINLLGKDNFFMDLFTFFASIIIGFLISLYLYKKSKTHSSNRFNNFTKIIIILCYLLILIMIICFLIFTKYPPSIEFFSQP